VRKFHINFYDDAVINPEVIIGKGGTVTHNDTVNLVQFTNDCLNHAVTF
jgi:hypothetical protein